MPSILIIGAGIDGVAATHPGIGVSIAFLGAGLIEELILKEQPTPQSVVRYGV